MMPKKLLIEYDEESQEIKFSEITGDQLPSLAIKVPVSLYTEAGPDKAEQRMGETVFTFLDRWSVTKIALRNYVADAEASLKEARSDISRKAKAGNAEAQYHLAIDCFTEGVKSRSRSAIEEAEAWLRKAAANGSKEAIEYLHSHWERDKASALRSIA